MALNMSLLGCFFLAWALNIASAQPLDESVYKQLTAEELRLLDFQQNPGLLEIAARTGERVVVDITGPSQGAVVQDSVNTVLNCLPWLQNFPGGTVMWFRYIYRDLDHTILSMRQPENREALNSATTIRGLIEGRYDEIYNITRTFITTEGQEDPSQGIYECEVCRARDTAFEECHSANTTVLAAGRAPILNDTSGREPDEIRDNSYRYRIGATICVNIDRFDATRNVPDGLVALTCMNIGAVPENNIPIALPAATFTWTHRSIDGSKEANLATNARSSDIEVSRMASPEFVDEFPLLESTPNLFVVSTAVPPGVSTLEFFTNNVTKNNSDARYRALREAFGFWTCRISNDLGYEEATTFISDMCGQFRPSIERRNCDDVGRLIRSDLALVERGQAVPITIGCDVCIRQAAELWLTIVCPTNVNSFPNTSVTIRWEDEDGNELQGVRDTLLVQQPGTYTCIADFGNNEIDREETSVGYVPDVQLQLLGARSSSSGCERLRTDQEFSPIDVCAFVGEDMNLECISSQINVTGTPQYEGNDRTSFTVGRNNDDEEIRCVLTMTTSDIEEGCIVVGGGSINLTVYEPARIFLDGTDTCTASAGGIYGTVPAPTLGEAAVLCCVADGYPTPVTTWSRVVVDSTGVARQLLVDETDPDISRVDNTLTIINYSPADDGTYVCQTENIAGVDSGTISITSVGVGFQWVTSPWSECDPLCVDGIRTRKVWCETVPEGVVVPDIRCNCDLRPPTSQVCSDVPGLDTCLLTPIWKTGEFSACSKGCAGGVRFRRVYCARPLDGSEVDDLECRELYGPDGMPPAYDICFNKCCKDDVFPSFCRSTGTGPCDNPVYQQYCCWTCGLTEFP